MSSIIDGASLSFHPPGGHRFGKIRRRGWHTPKLGTEIRRDGLPLLQRQFTGAFGSPTFSGPDAHLPRRIVLPAPSKQSVVDTIRALLPPPPDSASAPPPLSFSRGRVLPLTFGALSLRPEVARRRRSPPRPGGTERRRSARYHPVQIMSAGPATQLWSAISTQLDPDSRRAAVLSPSPPDRDRPFLPINLPACPCHHSF